MNTANNGKPTMLRKDAILNAASDHFGRFGFRGASLRDIARDAGVSLTLLNHHFGCKAALLAAVAAAQRPLLRGRVAALSRLMLARSEAPVAAELVRAWVGASFEMAGNPDGLRCLRLLARTMDDPWEEDVESNLAAHAAGRQAALDPLDDAALLFIDALQRCYPGAARRAVTLAYLCVDAALLKVLVGGVRVMRVADADRPSSASMQRARLERLLVAGVDAALSAVEQDAEYVDMEIGAGVEAVTGLAEWQPLDSMHDLARVGA